MSSLTDRKQQEERRRDAISEVARDFRRGPIGRATGMTQEQAERRVRDAVIADRKSSNKEL